MEYAVGVFLALSACSLSMLAGFDRDRALYPVMLIVIASYYDLFAVMGGAGLGPEAAVSLGFAAVSIVGFRFNLWIVAAAMAAHGVFDFVHGALIANPGVPVWWPEFCLSFDLVAAAFLGWLLMSGRLRAAPRAAHA